MAEGGGRSTNGGQQNNISAKSGYTMSERISTFKELQVYQLACALDEKIFIETKRWPTDEKFALIDQIRRSARAIGANLAESWLRPVEEF